MPRKSPVIVINARDNVATALEPLDAGAEVSIELDGRTWQIKIVSDIPQGHKFALRDFEKDESVVKYGEPIGRAAQAIRAGEHVHVHNVVNY